MSAPFLRLFLVGCPRSGTTILQSCLGAHPRMFTFQESRLMRTTGGRRAVAARLGVASRVAHAQMSAIYAELGLDAADCRPHFFQAGYVRDFAAAVDRACLAAGRDAWLEKTPDHLHHVGRLSRLIPGVRFVHILRGGFDNVCSLVDVTRKHRNWSTRPLTPPEAFERWAADVETSLACAGRPNHLLVRHADLVASTESVLRAVDRFAGLDFHPAQLAGMELGRIASDAEPWKKGVSGGVSLPDPTRYRDLLAEDERAWLLARVAPLQARIDALSFPRATAPVPL